MRSWNERPARILWGRHRNEPVPRNHRIQRIREIVGGPRYRLTKALTLERLQGLAWEP